MYNHNNGYFLVKLLISQDRDVVFLSGPYMITNRPIIMKKWMNDFDFNVEILQIIPIGVKLPNLSVILLGYGFS